MAISIRKIMINDTILGYSTLFSDKHRCQWKILRTHFGHVWTDFADDLRIRLADVSGDIFWWVWLQQPEPAKG